MEASDGTEVAGVETEERGSEGMRGVEMRNSSWAKTCDT